MAVPNHFDVVQQVFARGGFDIKTTDGCGLFTEACGRALHDIDPGFGMLRKTAGQGHVVDSAGNLHAVDAVLYLPTGQAVDLVNSSASAAAAVQWDEDIPRYSAKDWYETVAEVVVEPAPAADAPPPAPSFDIAAAFAQINEKLDALKTQIDVDTQKVQTQIGQVVKDAENSVKPYLGGIGALFGVK